MTSSVKWGKCYQPDSYENHVKTACLNTYHSIILSEISQTQKGQMFHIYEESRVVKFTETERMVVVAKYWGSRECGVGSYWVQSFSLR